jgi:hypothetical protein
MRLFAAAVLVLVPLVASAAESEVDIVSDLNAAITLATPDNGPVIGLGEGPLLGGRIRYDGVPWRGIPYAFSVDLAVYGPFSIWETSFGLGGGYWVGPVGFSLLGGLGLEGGGKSPRKAPPLLTLNLQASAAVDLGDLFRLRVWLKPSWLWTTVQTGSDTVPFSELTRTQPFLTIAGRPSDELNIGAALALTLPRRGPANHLYNGTATFWVGAEYRAIMKNTMVGFFVGYGAASGAYNGDPL